MTWSRKPSEAIVEILQAHADNTVRLGNDVYNTIVTDSPVREGVYRANHNASQNSPNYNFEKEKTSRSSSPFGKIKAFVNLFIANGAPYAEPLEKGHSTQARAGVYGPVHNFFLGKV